MPRQGAKGKWNLKMSPDEWYFNEDPWEVNTNNEETLKAMTILGLIKHDHVVDIGCGEGNWTHDFYFQNGKRSVVGMDVSAVAIGRAKHKYDLTYLWWEVYDIVNDNWFELESESTVILSEVLYYIDPKEWRKVNFNINEMMKEGGQLIVSVGQYFNEADIRNIFDGFEFDKVIKLPSEKYEYNLIMSGRKK